MNFVKLIHQNRIIQRSTLPLFKAQCYVLNSLADKRFMNELITTVPARLCSNFNANISQSEENAGFIKRLLKKISGAEESRPRLKVSGYILYENVADKLNYIEFFETFNLPNTFNSWFIVTELHIWMLLLRAMAEGSETGQDGRFLRNTIVEAMWADVNARAKKLGAHNPSGTRAQIEMLSEQFQAALIAYDEGIQSSDIVLASALWRRFFEQKCDDYTRLEKLVNYVRKQVSMLENLNKLNFMFKPKIEWIPLKDI
ncbi:ubiquinol-cytochrome-c reductase complex assembly factor 1 [Condylostylus longicornis]|uniref:ubiquinol-cytochrome-c reductase complex assembly factor 1 n=1 Tax=Condylostylus longicornis TaxID=2530218 RepID=UPI00244E1574|nr:ubiquinol-cytochrome-c reductase complex assembly factor 1 [Condylostylus longicornis]